MEAFEHILVPVGSPRVRPAVDLAVELVAPGGRVTLLHVIEIIRDTGLEEFGDFYGALAERARREMDALAAPHAAAGAPLVRELAYGDRVGEILAFVEREAVDLIALQSHRVDPHDPTRGWSTISYKVGILAPCPVLLVK